VFDLDGTLIDSKRDLAESANEMLSAFGVAALDEREIASFVGDGARQLVARTLEAAGVITDVSAALERFLAIYGGRLFAHTQPYPGILQALSALAPQATLCVLTNKPEGFSRQLLDGFGMSALFWRVIGGDSGFPRKPDPSGLLDLMRRAGVDSKACLFVGDSMVDVETARAARASVCVAEYGFGHLRRPIDRDGTEFVARRPEDLGSVIEVYLRSLPRQPEAR
jgi:phosphoglycolate phosphatase